MLDSLERQIPPAILGYPLTAFITTQVTQRRLDEVAAALGDITEVLQVHGISGLIDLLGPVAHGKVMRTHHGRRITTPEPLCTA